MRTPGRACTVVALLLLAVVPSAAAQAEPDALTVSSARYHGGANQDGLLTALFASDTFTAGSLTEPAPTTQYATPYLELQAEHLEAVRVTTTYPVGVEVGPLYQTFNQPLAEPEVTHEALEHAKATLTGHQQGFQLHVLAMQEPVSYKGRAEAGRFVPMDSLYIGSGWFSDGPNSTASYIDQDPESGGFWGVHFPTPHVGHDDESGLVDVTLRGTFVLELHGLSIEARHGNEQVRWSSGTFRTSPVEGAPVFEEDYVLLRLFVEDGVLRFATQGGAPVLSWGAPSLRSTQDGPTTLLGARGPIDSGAGSVTLRDETFLLPAGNQLGLVPASQGLRLDVLPAATTGAAAPGAGLAGPTWAVAAAAVAALLVAVLLGLSRRSRGTVDLPAIESALGSGAYRRAARMARTLLRRNPGQEDVLLARAIALSKSDQPGRVVAEVGRHLATREPADGRCTMSWALPCSTKALARTRAPPSRRPSRARRCCARRLRPGSGPPWGLPRPSRRPAGRPTGMLEPDAQRLAEQPVRRRLLDLISSRPGIHGSQLSRESGEAWGTVQYHLSLLQRGDLVRTLETGRERRYFPAGLEPGHARLLALMAQGRRPEVAQFIQENPGSRQVDVCEALALSRKTFRGAIQPLVAENLVRQRRSLQDTRYFPLEGLASLLQAAVPDASLALEGEPDPLRFA